MLGLRAPLWVPDSFAASTGETRTAIQTVRPAIQRAFFSDFIKGLDQGAQQCERARVYLML